jgi:hypothetical protein
MVPATVVVWEEAAVPLKVALTAGALVKVPEPVNAVETPLTLTDPLKLTFALKPLVTILAMPVCKSKLEVGEGAAVLLPPPHADKRIAKHATA